jgi:hypothetical protein
MSMLAGMAVWLLTMLLLPEQEQTDPAATGWQIWLGIPPMLYGFAAGIAGMLIGSYIFPDKQKVVR